MQNKDIVGVLTDYGCTDISSYNLVNNYGYEFRYDEKKYDARFWKNCYGVELNKWEISGSKENQDIKELENILNEKCR